MEIVCDSKSVTMARDSTRINLRLSAWVSPASENVCASSKVVWKSTLAPEVGLSRRCPVKPRAQVHCCCEFKAIQEPVLITPHLSCQSEITWVLGTISVFFGSAPALEKTYKRLGRVLRLLLKYPVARVFHDDNGYIFSNQFHLSPECFSQ
jgi:hypothetical protein